MELSDSVGAMGAETATCHRPTSLVGKGEMTVQAQANGRRPRKPHRRWSFHNPLHHIIAGSTS